MTQGQEYQLLGVPVITSETVPSNEIWFLSPSAAEMVEAFEAGMINRETLDAILEADLRLHRSAKVINLGT